MREIGKAFILRLSSDESERRLYVRRWMYVGLRRSWSKGSRILFLNKLDAFLGFGVVEKVRPIEELPENERNLCLQSNWSSKLHFSTLVRFIPPLTISATPAATENTKILHGSELSEGATIRIEELAFTKIVT